MVVGQGDTNMVVHPGPRLFAKSTGDSLCLADLS
jgi:hypothetical protein